MPRARDASSTFDMFEVPQPPAPIGGSLDYDTELRHVLSDALKHSVFDRYEVAARMSRLTGQDITKAMLDAWTAESKTPWRFPFSFAAAFEAATETFCLQQLLGRKRGTTLLVGKDVLLAELGRVQQEKVELAERERAIKQRIGAGR